MLSRDDVCRIWQEKVKEHGWQPGTTAEVFCASLLAEMSRESSAVTRYDLITPSVGGEPLELELENGRLVKVNGARPEYMDGYRLIRLVRRLGEDLTKTKEALKTAASVGYRALALRKCQCESPVIRCDMNGCRCTVCGEPG